MPKTRNATVLQVVARLPLPLAVLAGEGRGGGCGRSTSAAAVARDLRYSVNTYTIEHALAYFSAAGRVVACHFGPAATATYCLPLTA
jgi:hypothetical protein